MYHAVRIVAGVVLVLAALAPAAWLYTEGGEAGQMLGAFFGAAVLGALAWIVITATMRRP